MRIRVLLVDDSPEFLNAAQRFLELQPCLEIVGAVTSGNEALAAVPLLNPDLVLLDWTMPGLTGLESAGLLKTLPEAPRVVMLTLREGPFYRSAVAAAGADGFANKSDWTSELIPLIQRLFDTTLQLPGPG